jgi:hypothetical protein
MSTIMAKESKSPKEIISEDPRLEAQEYVKGGVAAARECSAAARWAWPLVKAESVRCRARFRFEPEGIRLLKGPYRYFFALPILALRSRHGDQANRQQTRHGLRRVRQSHTQLDSALCALGGRNFSGSLIPMSNWG